jgi:hypothetical protein
MGNNTSVNHQEFLHVSLYRITVLIDPAKLLTSNVRISTDMFYIQEPIDYIRNIAQNKETLGLYRFKGGEHGGPKGGLE